MVLQDRARPLRVSLSGSGYLTPSDIASAEFTLCITETNNDEACVQVKRRRKPPAQGSPFNPTQVNSGNVVSVMDFGGDIGYIFEGDL